MLVAGHALGDNGMDSPFVGQKKKKKSRKGRFSERLCRAALECKTTNRHAMPDDGRVVRDFLGRIQLA